MCPSQGEGCNNSVTPPGRTREPHHRDDRDAEYQSDPVRSVTRTVGLSSGPRHQPVREQSSRSLPSTDAPARKADAALQIGRPRTTLRVRAGVVLNLNAANLLKRLAPQTGIPSS